MMTVNNYLNTVKNLVPFQNYFIGAVKGTVPHLLLMAPKKLYEWTNYQIFDLMDISVRGYRNIPKINGSLFDLGAKTTLLTAAGIRLLRFINMIPTSVGLPIDLFLIFASTVSSIKSLKKGFSLLGKVFFSSAQVMGSNPNIQQMFTENLSSGLFYCALGTSKIFSFIASSSILYWSFKPIIENNEFFYESPYACFDITNATFTPMSLSAM